MIPKIQLALDCLCTEDAIKVLASGVADEVDIVECGYCMIAREGARQFVCRWSGCSRLR